jgi:serine/threonine protein kinase, bacterial
MAEMNPRKGRALMSVAMVTMQLDGHVVRLREAHDFSFLHRLGAVCCVLDEQDSGNICFGVDNGTERLFVKYAGAQTIEYPGKPDDAVARLRQAMLTYQALRHPALIELREHFSTEAGYAAVFTWFPGECLHAHWAFTPAEKYTHPDSPSYRHKQLPVPQRLDSLDTIFAFHVFVAQQGYVAIDFYDGSVLYDFQQQRTMICDIDYYQPRPYRNTMGRLWGSTRFMSPEEFVLDAEIDEVTNVYTMGATAFALLGDAHDRSFARWDAGVALYAVACKAVSPERTQRYPSLAAFQHAWNAARHHQGGCHLW